MNVLAWALAGVVGVLTAHSFVNALLLRRPSPAPSTVEFPVAVLLPVRDEASRVGPCLSSVLSQRGVPQLEVIVLDDGSRDGTAAVVRSLGGRLVPGAPLPGGWLGKPHACWQLAGLTTAPVLVFIDADTVLSPAAVASAVAALSGFDLVSPYPRVVAGSVGERLVQPLLHWSWLTFLPLRGMERSRRESLAAAGGQFLVVRRDAYLRAGGHEAVRDKVLEDIELARAVKRTGGRIALVDGSTLATCRMYESWHDVRAGYAKSLWASFGSPPGAAAIVVLLLALYVLPLALIPFAPLAGLTGYLLGVLGRLVTGRVGRSRLLPDVLAHPLSVCAFGYLVVVSYVDRRRGRLSWKGRSVR
jgi:cellulose synthase/poly-beta-1,6-N-acetylglucosamine synthase-like glycosyltransferase